MLPPPSPELVARFRNDLGALAGQGPLAVAVSGGADSLALLLLGAAALPGAIAAATVDHGLRAEAGAEAEFVARVCGELAVPHRILRATVDPTRSSLQRAAREARYAALAQWLTEAEFAAIATAHHADDQAETLIMRLLRGSGIGGLAGVRASIPVPAAGSSARLLRPLLTWRKTELRALVEQCGLVPVDDPSNSDERFDRVRIRRFLAESEWVDPLPLARSAAALADADEALHWAAERLADERIAEGEDYWTLDPREIPAEILRRLVLRILAECGGAAAPRGEDLTSLIEKLERGETATLAGVKGRGGASWTFEREAGRRR